jgi:carbamoyltransferase
MKVLGLSGLPNGIRFRRSEWPDLEEREYRIAQGLDASAALVIDGVIVAAAAEERFNGQKHSERFPAGAIEFCLRQAGLSLDDVDEVGHCFDYSPHRRSYLYHNVSARLYREALGPPAMLESLRAYDPEFPPQRFQPVNHHLSHAASAFFTSGWDECLVIVIDAMGETDSLSVYAGRGQTLRKIHSAGWRDSLGILYSLITLHLGFDFNADEYKIMGLAPYGDPERYRARVESLVHLTQEGGLCIPLLRKQLSYLDDPGMRGARRELEPLLGKPRSPDEPVLQEHCDVAAALQACLERAVLHVCGSFGASTGLTRLALGGGVALNCCANGRLMRSGLFDAVYVQPAAGDDGAALGAALYRSSLSEPVVNVRMPAPLLGPCYPQDDIEAALLEFQDRIEVVRFSDLSRTCRKAAKMIAEGSVIAWYRGRMEFGARALGNRSILGDPRPAAMRELINAMIKKREAFRPFAPAVSLEQAHIYFDVPAGAEFPHMVATVPVREAFQSRLGAVTHVDGSARVQTVAARDHPAFHALLKAVGARLGMEVVLNTSFNVKGQPIVNTPREAVSTFLSTGLNALFLQDTLVLRRHAAD